MHSNHKNISVSTKDRENVCAFNLQGVWLPFKMNYFFTLWAAQKGFNNNINHLMRYDMVNVLASNLLTHQGHIYTRAAQIQCELLCSRCRLYKEVFPVLSDAEAKDENMTDISLCGHRWVLWGVTGPSCWSRMALINQSTAKRYVSNFIFIC